MRTDRRTDVADHMAAPAVEPLNAAVGRGEELLSPDGELLIMPGQLTQDANLRGWLKPAASGEPARVELWIDGERVSAGTCSISRRVRRYPEEAGSGFNLSVPQHFWDGRLHALFIRDVSGGRSFVRQHTLARLHAGGRIEIAEVLEGEPGSPAYLAALQPPPDEAENPRKEDPEAIAAAKALFEGKDFAKAVEWMEDHLAANPHNLQICVLLARSYAKLNEHGKACQWFGHYIARRPASPPIRRMYIKSLSHIGGHAEIVTQYRALGAENDSITAGYALTSLFEIGEEAEAIALGIERLAISRDRAKDAAQHFDSLVKKGKHESAERWIAACLQHLPLEWPLHLRRIDNLMKLGRQQQACNAIADLPLPLRTQYKVMRQELDCLTAMHAWDEALSTVTALLLETPADLALLTARVRILLNLADLDGALAACDAAIAQVPGDARLHQLRGDTMIRMARFEDALACYRDAVALAPKDALSHRRLSASLQLEGLFAEAFDEHEWRRKSPSFINANAVPAVPEWDGAITDQTRLLVWGEAGYGVGQNILNFAHLSTLVALGLDVSLRIEDRLIPLFKRSLPSVDMIPESAGQPGREVTAHIPIGSLSRIFRREREHFRFSRSFLQADPALTAAFRDALKAKLGRNTLLVGISWVSVNPFVGDDKSVPLPDLLKGLAMPGVSLVSLQYGDVSADIAAATAAAGIPLHVHPGVDLTNDLDSLAALVSALDLVVCIGHTTAHLAGGLGVPNQVIVPASPFAHWLREGDACVWYPHSKILRRAPGDEDWGPVLSQARSLLAQALRDHRTAGDATVMRKLDPVPPEEIGVMRLQTARFALDSGNIGGAIALLRSTGHLLPEGHLLLADCLAQQGRWNEARAAYRDAASSGVAPPVIDARLIELETAAHDLASAGAAARRLCLAEPSPANLHALARLQAAIGDDASAASTLNRHDLAETMPVERLLLLSEIERKRGALDAAGSLMREAAALAPDDADVMVETGHVHYSAGRLREAIRSFGAAHARAASAATAYWYVTARSDIGNADEPVPPAMKRPRLRGVLPDVTPGDVVLYFCCDGAYFLKYGIAAALSLDANAPGHHLHIHVVNPGDEALEAGELLRAALSATALSLSHEQADLDDKEPDFRRTYFASIRFVRLYQIYSEAPAHYLALDVDCIIRGSLGNLRDTEAGADILLLRRYHTRSYLRFAAGALFVRPRPGAARFMRALSDRIWTAIESGSARWFLDQVALNHVAEETEARGCVIGQLPETYIDWYFRDSTSIWTGKGKRKHLNARYVAEQGSYMRHAGLADLREYLWSQRGSNGSAAPGRRVLLFLPQLNIPFKEPGLAVPAKTVADLRLNWITFAEKLAAALEAAGLNVLRVVSPAWKITAGLVARFRPAAVILPHKQSFQVAAPDCLNYYYMQVVFPWVFSLDGKGWGAGSSHYPVRLPPAMGARTIDLYAEQVSAGNVSKFAQPEMMDRQALIDAGAIPDGRYIFFACQIFNDETIRFFSDVSLEDVVVALARWANERHVHVVFKRHPLDRKSDGSFKSGNLHEKATGPYVRWTDQSIHGLIANAAAVYAINSGVGVEAMLHTKPIVLFGKADYDCVTYPGDLQRLDEAWRYCNLARTATLRDAYDRFYDWHFRRYGYDLALDPDTGARLAGFARMLADRLDNPPEMAVAPPGDAHSPAPERGDEDA